MDIFPAIDLQNGACVRLRQGDFADATVYEADPIVMATRLRAAGARWLHIVDLDGAQAGSIRQRALIGGLARMDGLQIQTGGGVRSTGDVRSLLDYGVARVVVGSMAIKDPAKVREWLQKFGPDKIVLAFDARQNDDGLFEVLTHGWQKGSSQTLEDALGCYEGSGLETILCTDVAKDGMLTGPNMDLYQSLLKTHPKLSILASGGVGGRADLDALATLGVAGAIVGKAMYEGKLDIEETLKAFSKEAPAC